MPSDEGSGVGENQYVPDPSVWAQPATAGALQCPDDDVRSYSVYRRMPSTDPPPFTGNRVTIHDEYRISYESS